MSKIINGHTHYMRVCPECEERKWIRTGLTYCSLSCASKANNNLASMRMPKRFKGTRNEYMKLHMRVYSKRGKANKCVHGCTKVTRYEWANLTGHYDNTEDYTMMCAACHYRFDKYRVAVIVTHKGLT